MVKIKNNPGKANAMGTQRSSFRGLRLRIFVLTLIISFTFALKGTIKAAAEKPAQENKAAPLIIKDITFKLEKGGEEIVLIYANHYFEPKIFALDGGKPRLVIDIKNVINYKKGSSKIAVNGKLIRQIRTYLNPKSKILRVVLDHYTSMNYIVKQVFFEVDNIYILRVEKQ